MNVVGGVAAYARVENLSQAEYLISMQTDQY
jgi:hypothetical protein